MCFLASPNQVLTHAARAKGPGQGNFLALDDRRHILPDVAWPAARTAQRGPLGVLLLSLQNLVARAARALAGSYTLHTTCVASRQGARSACQASKTAFRSHCVRPYGTLHVRISSRAHMRDWKILIVARLALTRALRAHHARLHRELLCRCSAAARALPCAHGPSRAACERSERADNKLDNARSVRKHLVSCRLITYRPARSMLTHFRRNSRRALPVNWLGELTDI